MTAAITMLQLRFQTALNDTSGIAIELIETHFKSPICAFVAKATSTSIQWELIDTGMVIYLHDIDDNLFGVAKQHRLTNRTLEVGKWNVNGRMYMQLDIGGGIKFQEARTDFTTTGELYLCVFTAIEEIIKNIICTYAHMNTKNSQC